MHEQLDLLPPNKTELETALSLATDFYVKLDEQIAAMRGLKIRNPPPSFLPYLVYEYGLGELTPYLPNLYDLIDEGIDWQRVRGTPAAVYRALGWLNFSGEIEEPPVRRMRWNLFQLELSRVRDDNELDLPRIEGVAQLSVALRSVFWRGFKGYDVRALDYGWTKWGQTRWGAYSGVRLTNQQAKWSFGRTYDYDLLLSDDELEDLSVYLPPAGAGPAVWWTFPWPDVPWQDNASLARSAAMLAALEIGTPWLVFKNAGGAVIGYRRAKACRPVEAMVGGIYRVGSARFSVKNTGASVLYVEGLTDFGDAFGSTAASVGLLFNAVPLAPNPIGDLWVPPGGLSVNGPIVAARPIAVQFGRTVRERVRFALRF